MGFITARTLNRGREGGYLSGQYEILKTGVSEIPSSLDLGCLPATPCETPFVNLGFIALITILGTDGWLLVLLPHLLDNKLVVRGVV